MTRPVLDAMPHCYDGPALRSWLANAELGEWCCYRVGTFLRGGEAQSAALAGARAGKLMLAQMRLDPPGEKSRFAYLAKRAAVGK